MRIGRRGFLKLSGLFAAGAAVSPVLPPVYAAPRPNPSRLLPGSTGVVEPQAITGAAADYMTDLRLVGRFTAATTTSVTSMHLVDERGMGSKPNPFAPVYLAAQDVLEVTYTPSLSDELPGRLWMVLEDRTGQQVGKELMTWL